VLWSGFSAGGPAPPSKRAPSQISNRTPKALRVLYTATACQAHPCPRYFIRASSSSVPPEYLNLASEKLGALNVLRALRDAQYSSVG
jgi:hypothetical protein